MLLADFRDAGHRHRYAQVFDGAEGKGFPADVVGVHVLLQLAMPPGEDGLEAVLHFRVYGTILGVQRQAVVGDGHAVAPVDVLAGKGEEETHGAEAVRERVENVKVDLLAAGAHAVEEAVLIGKIEGLEGLDGADLWVTLDAFEVPPERAGLELAAEGGDALGGFKEGLLEDIFVDIFRECDFHPVERAVVLAHGCGIYVGGIVKP